MQWPTRAFLRWVGTMTLAYHRYMAISFFAQCVSGFDITFETALFRLPDKLEYHQG